MITAADLRLLAVDPGELRLRHAPLRELGHSDLELAHARGYVSSRMFVWETWRRRQP